MHLCARTREVAQIAHCIHKAFYGGFQQIKTWTFLEGCLQARHCSIRAMLHLFRCRTCPSCVWCLTEELSIAHRLQKAALQPRSAVAVMQALQLPEINPPTEIHLSHENLMEKCFAYYTSRLGPLLVRRNNRGDIETSF